MHKWRLQQEAKRAKANTNTKMKTKTNQTRRALDLILTRKSRGRSRRRSKRKRKRKRKSQKGTITSAGDKLIKGSKLPTYKQAWDQDIDGIRTGKGYGGVFENYLKDMGQIQKGDARDIQREKARKVAATVLKRVRKNIGY